MRTYGRIPDENGKLVWVEVNSDAAGTDDYVMVTTLIQNLKLILGESPFFANYGIPAEQSIIQQIFPDFYVAQVQRQFASFFASLIITKIPNTRDPTYRVNIITKFGTRFQVSIPQ